MINNFQGLIPNPQQMVQQMLQQNPQLNGVLNQIRSSGMTPTQFLNQYARQHNINQNQMLQALRQMGIKL